MKTLLVFLPLIVLFFGCSKDDDLSCNNSSTLPQAPHIEHFGFTLIDTYFDDPTDVEEKTNYIDEVHTFCNTADILVLTPSDNILERMQAMDDLDMKALLHLNEIFFEFVGEGGSLSGYQYDLYENYQQRWDSFVSTNNLTTNHTLVQAFYIGEEPTWNGIDSGELTAACDYVKTTIPSVPIMIVEAYPSLDLLEVPESADWIGFDHYFIKDPSTDPTFLFEYELLESKLTNSDQRTVLIMDAHYIPWAHGNFAGIAEAEMRNVALNYYTKAAQHSKVVGLIGYHWPSGFEFEDAIGARGLNQNTLETYEMIGRQITGKE